jgi:TRAP-type C4-dicarboxylate transport system permease small subunit
MKHTIKNIILSVISICCLVFAIHLFLGGVDNISADNNDISVEEPQGIRSILL